MHGIVGRGKTARRAASGDARKGSAATVRIPEKLDRALARIVERTGKSRGYFVRKGLERIIEDTYDRLLAAEALKKSRGKTYSLLEVEKRLGLDA
jgi:predicted DNA-binding protein